MNQTLNTIIELFGSQVKAAARLGVTDRTLRNYVKFPKKIPKPMQNLMTSILVQEELTNNPAPGAQKEEQP